MKLVASGIVFLTVLGFIACSSSDPPTPVRDAGIEASGPDDANEIPCDVREVLQTVCQQCHSSPPVRGAPFPLVTRSNILTQRPGGVARDLMIAQLQAHRMPLAPVTIDEADRATLLAWLQGGAVAVTPQSCAPGDGGTDADADAAQDADADADDGAADADSATDAADD
jgi:uncharacterized membrane protein